MKRLLPILVIALAIATAGCINPSSNKNTPTPSEDTDKLGPKQLSKEVFQTHYDKLEEADSYTTKHVNSYSINGTTYTSLKFYQIDNNNQRYKVRFDLPQVQATKYTDKTGTYVKIGGTNTTYEYAKPENYGRIQPVNINKSEGFNNLVFDASTSYERVGFTTYKGDKVAVYKYSGDILSEKIASSSKKITAVNEVNSKIYYNSDGVLVYQKITFTAQYNNMTVNGKRVYKFTKIGETSVQEPTWLSKAES